MPWTFLKFSHFNVGGKFIREGLLLERGVYFRFIKKRFINASRTNFVNLINSVSWYTCICNVSGECNFASNLVY